MLVEIENVRRFPWSPLPVVQVQTRVGRTAVPWRGGQCAPLGQYDVEWTIGTEIRWGVNAKSATEAGPALLAGGHCVIFRGRLHLAPDGAGALDLDGSMILLDFAEPPPPEVDGTWVQLHIAHQKISLHPYEL